MPTEGKQCNKLWLHPAEDSCKISAFEFAAEGTQGEQMLQFDVYTDNSLTMITAVTTSPQQMGSKQPLL